MNGRPRSLGRELVLTVLGSGYSPLASGTTGSMMSVALFACAWVGIGIGLGHWSRSIEAALLLSGAALAVALGVAWGDWAIERWGRKDPKPFVLDEFAGQWLALLLLVPAPAAGWWSFAAVAAVQFFLFRVMDVVKPWPASYIDREWPGGYGIVFDDLFAGIYANLAGQLAWRLTPLAAWLGVAGFA